MVCAIRIFLLIYMYSLNDLDTMADEQLKSVAQSLGLDKIDLTKKQELIYRILDEQAIASAAATTERQKKKTAAGAEAPKKRGRKKKSEGAETPAADDAPAAEAPKKKRGRKSQEAEAAESPATDENAQPQAAREVAAPAVTEPVQGDEPAKKRRGRPSKKDKAAAEAVEARDESASEPEMPAAAEDESMAAPAPEAEAAPAPSEQPVPHIENPQGEFSAFFPRSEGRKFVPRSQQARDEERRERQQHQQQYPQQRYEQSNEPIIITEPGMQVPGMQGQGKKKNKKNKQQQQQVVADQRLPQQQRYDFEDLLQTQGVLEVMPEGHGFLRSSDFNYMPSPDDVLLTQQQVKAAALKTGDVVECTVRPPREGEKFFPMCRLLQVNGRSPEYIRDRVPFEHLTPLFPDEKFDLTGRSSSNLSTRVVDMFAPIGKGQRALIVAPPKTGKTLLLKDIANAIADNHPETYIMILLIDERPEEVTDMSRSVKAEVIASTFDEPADRHVRIASIVLEKAKRMVESGHDVVILLDSITRLARAYNTVAPASGKILSGGVDANALQKPKRFFGAARNIEGGGSLTIIATALTETSSKMDEVIFEEFKGTGNMELQLDRRLSNKRIFPAVDIIASSTRRDDLLLREETLNRMWILRRFLSDRNSIEAMEFIKDRMERTRDNDELLRTMGE